MDALNWAQALTGIGMFSVSTWGVYYTKRKFDLDKQIQRRKEWKYREPVFIAAVQVCQSASMSSHTLEQLNAFSVYCHKSRLLFNKDIQKYVWDIYRRASNLGAINEQLKNMEPKPERDILLLITV
jgi:hypothetical protein